MMESHSIPLSPAQARIILCPVYPAHSLSSHLGHQNACVQVTLFYLIVAPEYKTSDSGNSDILLLCLIYKLNFIIGIYA